MKQILKNGKTVEVADNYELKAGESFVEATAGSDGWVEAKPTLKPDEEAPTGFSGSETISSGEASVPLHKPFKVIAAQKTFPVVDNVPRLVYQLELAFQDGSTIQIASTTFTRSLRNIVKNDDNVDNKTVVSARTLRPQDRTNGRFIGQVFAGATSGREVVEKCKDIIFEAVAEDRRTCRFNAGTADQRDSSRYVVCAIEVA